MIRGGSVTQTEQTPRNLTDVVAAARRGLRRDVAELTGALAQGQLIMPLRKDVAGAVEGENMVIDGELELSPHLISDEDGKHYAVLFTEPSLMERVAKGLCWDTDGSDVKGCTLPARLACEMSLDVVDEENVFGLVVNPGDESELFLRRSELASIVAGQPLPLVGYLADLPPLDDERILVAEGTGLTPELASEVARCLGSQSGVAGHRVERTFNPERDLEPHPTLTILLSDEAADRRAIAQAVITSIGERLPPPGYLDILFEEAGGEA
jgi:hypothetical protein